MLGKQRQSRVRSPERSHDRFELWHIDQLARMTDILGQRRQGFAERRQDSRDRIGCRSLVGNGFKLGIGCRRVLTDAPGQ